MPHAMTPTIHTQPTQVQTDKWLTPMIIAKLSRPISPNTHYTANVSLYDCRGAHVASCLQGNSNTQGLAYDRGIYFLWDWLKIVQPGVYEMEISVQEWSLDYQQVKSCGSIRTRPIDVVDTDVTSRLSSKVANLVTALHSL